MKVKTSLKSRSWFYTKAAIACGLLYYLYKQGYLSSESFRVFVEYPVVSMAVASIFVCNILLSSLRWEWLLSALDIDLRYSTILDINAIGSFGSVFLLGSAGGDALRAYYATGKAPHAKTKVLLSLIIDRVLGLTALLILTAMAAAWYYTRLDSDSGSGEFIKTIFVLLLLCASGVVAVFFMANRFNIRARLSESKQHLRIIRLIVQVLDVIVIFKKKFWTICACLLTSVVMQLGSLWSLSFLGRTMGIGDLSTLEYMTASSFSLLANSIPLTPGGIGIGEGAFNYFCQLLSANKEALAYSSIFFAYRIIISLVSLVGLWRFIVHKSRIPQNPLTSTQPLA